LSNVSLVLENLSCFLVGTVKLKVFQIIFYKKFLNIKENMSWMNQCVELWAYDKE